ncbi:30S ribosomal protein S15 [Ureaplasma canigenitalium]|uniref:30S ribosomal protein S15 n=1 Tax=Ureaplasma canigenitalium TaxID=42092 RepID=UPI0004E286A4|nr:30S ribosomal protein S15 [Ureaplasma canigenitalium]
MAVQKEQIMEMIKRFGGSEKNSGKTEVQIAIISLKIANLTEHMVKNKKDKSSKRGLYMMVAQRKKLLAYLQRVDIEKYRSLIKDLKLRG